MTIGERIKLYREKKELTQEQLGEIIGVKGATITRYEKNNRQPNVETFAKLAKALEVNINELLGMAPVKINGKTIEINGETFNIIPRMLEADTKTIINIGQSMLDKRVKEYIDCFRLFLMMCNRKDIASLEDEELKKILLYPELDTMLNNLYLTYLQREGKLNIKEGE